MSVSQYDSYRPPEPARRRRRGPGREGGEARGRRARRRAEPGAGDGSREMSMVPEPQFDSYYGRPVVKAPPWDERIAGYLFLGGLAGGSALLALGGQLTGRPALRRNARLTALTAASLGSLLLIADLGRPERFHHMLRVVKPTSPMSIGTWILAGFGTSSGVAAAAEVDRMTGERLPLGPLRSVLRALEPPAGVGAGLLAGPLASYTGVLLSDTAMPTWNAARDQLPIVFTSSASLASGGLAMITTPVDQARPARTLAVIGVAGELIATRAMEHDMDPVAAEPLHEGTAGILMRWSERLAIAGGFGTLLGGRRRWAAVASGAALTAASALTRFGVFYAGINSAHDPKYTVEPQRNRLAARRRAGITDDSITTSG